jgi:flagellar biosynthesis protein FlhG
MVDAQELQRAGMVARLHSNLGPDPRPDRRREIIAIGGGKGGIGKSLISTNLGIIYARGGDTVVLVDADLGGANVHTCLGMQTPTVTLSDFVNRRVQDISEVITPTPIDNLFLISGALDYVGAANPKYTQKLRVIREIARLNVDVIIIDLGAGTGFNVLDFFLLADQRIVIMMPEATSIENAYRFIKTAYYRKLKNAEMAWGLKAIVDEIMDTPGAGLRTPADLVREVSRRDAEGGRHLQEELDDFRINIVINQTRLPEDEEVGLAIERACRKFFGIPTTYLGALPYEDAVWQAVRNRKTLVDFYPESQVVRRLRRISVRLHG